MGVAEPAGRFPGGEVVRALVGEHRRERIEEREVEMLAHAGLGAVRERRAHGDRRVHAGHDVGDRDARLLRPAAGQVVALAGDAHQPGHPLDHEVVAGPLAVRAGLAEAGDRAVDEPRVDLLQVVVAEPVAGEVAELVVLEQHVATRRELAHHALPGGLREIDGDRLLAPVGAGEVRRLGRLLAARILQPRRAERARVVPLLRTLDLDHLRAEVGEVLPGPRRGEHAREIEDADVGQRTGHDGNLSDGVERQL